MSRGGDTPAHHNKQRIPRSEGGTPHYSLIRIMHTNSQQGLLLDIVVGIVGAFLAGYFISPLLGVGTINDAITLPTLLVSLLGAVVLLAIYKAVARR